MTGHWSEGLLHTMRNPQFVVITTDKLVAIKDKYPKAHAHYLVLPLENIPTIFHVGVPNLHIITAATLIIVELQYNIFHS